MKQFFSILFLATVFSVGAQNLKLKPTYSASGSSTLKFQTEHLKGSVKASNTELLVKVKNTSKQTVVLSEKHIVLKDLTGKGETLCGGGEVELKPGKSITLTLVNCAAKNHPDEGLFQLDAYYPSKAAFKEDAFFLRNKEFFLHVGGDVVAFYTDI